MNALAALLFLVGSLVPCAAVEPEGLAATPRSDWQWRTLQLADGRSLHYALLLPEAYDAEQEYPVMLGLPPGGQDESLVEWCLQNYWSSEARRLGWIVVSPAAPEGQRFTGAPGGPIEELLDLIAREFHAEGGAPHLVGVSNGGLAAFEVATRNPGRILSLLGQPGIPGTEEVFAALDQIAELPVALMVGGDDAGWRSETLRARDRLAKLAAYPPPMIVFEGQGHVPDDLLGGALIFEQLETFRALVARRRRLRQAVEAVLDDFHLAASQADGTRYFAHLAPDAVFLGTDASERWSVAEFQAYAEPFFSAGDGWTYVASRRQVSLSADLSLAWFDEDLHNDKYGSVRGSGVLRLRDDDWKIVQYNLAFPVPNALAEEVLGRIQEAEGK